MSLKKVLIPEVGEVVLAKRRGSTHLRLSVTAKGVVRVGMPYWTPYSAGIKFARDRSDWINKHLGQHRISDFKDGDRLGKSHTIYIEINKSLGKPKARVTTTDVKIVSPYTPGDPRTQLKVIEASNKALRKEANALLPQRLKSLAVQHGFQYSEVSIRGLTSRWGSCSSKKVITLSYFLIQLPWNLIDYVLLHELVHTEHMNHGPEFWNRLEQILPGAKKIRKQVNSHKPRAIANDSGHIVGQKLD